MSEVKSYKKFDTYSQTTYLVRLAMDARVFERDDKGEDVVLTFCDNTRIEGTEEMWVDARVSKYQGDMCKQFRKGDTVQIAGKLRFKRGNDGNLRGKIYDARVASFANFGREDYAEEKDPVPPAFE